MKFSTSLSWWIVTQQNITSALQKLKNYLFRCFYFETFRHILLLSKTQKLLNITQQKCEKRKERIVRFQEQGIMNKKLFLEVSLLNDEKNILSNLNWPFCFNSFRRNLSSFTSCFCFSEKIPHGKSKNIHLQLNRSNGTKLKIFITEGTKIKQAHMYCMYQINRE